MFTPNDVLLQLVPQDQFGELATEANGQVIPWSNGTSIKDGHGRNLITNPAVFRDGFRRKPARGNHTSKLSFKVVPNLSWLGWILSYLSGNLASVHGVKSCAVTAGGTGYTVPFAVSFTGGGGTGAAGTATVSAGVVISVAITNYGSGYTAAPTPDFTAGSGTGATGTSALWYVHTGTLSLVEKYFLVEAGWSDATLYYRFLNQMMNSLKLTCPVEGIFELGFDTVGSGHLTGPEITSIDSSPTELAGDPGEYANMTILEDDVDSGVVRELGLDITINAPEKRVHNKGGKASDIRRGGIEVKGTLGTYFESDAHWSRARSGTLQSINALLAQGADEFEFRLPEVDLQPTGPEVESEDGTIQNFSFESIYQADAQSPFWFQLRNQVASYPLV